MDGSLPTQLVPLADLRPHPKNYRTHPPDQLAHIQASLTANGFYRPVVAARDLTILAGHGLVLAATDLGLGAAPTVVLDLDPEDPLALRILVGDNQISQLAMIEDRHLTTLLQALYQDDPVAGLLGTGFDDAMLANYVMVTRPRSEIPDFDAAAHWVGMPSFTNAGTGPACSVLLHFASEADRTEAFRRLEVPLHLQPKSVWFPYRPNDDIASVRFEQRDAPDRVPF